MLSRSNKIYLCCAVGAIVLLPLIHVVTYSLPFFYEITQILVIGLTAAWMLSVEKRVISRELRTNLWFIGAHLILYIFVTMIKHHCFTADHTVIRYIWYSSYIPMTAVPLRSLFVALDMRATEKKRSGVRSLLYAVALLLIAGVMTNDWHRLAFDFPGGIELGEHKCTHGVLYWIIFAWNICLYGAALIIMLKNCRLERRGKYLWCPLLPLMLGAAFFMVDLLKTDLIRVNGSRVLSVAEVFVLMEIGFFEGCIQIGLISSNSMYSRFFSAAALPAAVLNAKNEAIYRTEASHSYDKNSLPEPGRTLRELGGGIRLRRLPVTGGSLVYEEDLSVLEDLESKIRHETEMAETRNAYLAHENELKEEKARIDAKTKLYDRIGTQIAPQQIKLRRLIEKAKTQDEPEFRALLAKGCILNAYIKRRSNLELIAGEQKGPVSLTELASAVTESLEYAKLCGTETAMISGFDTSRMLSIDEAAGLYEGLETVLEETAGIIRFMTVSLASDDCGPVGLRIMLSPASQVPEAALNRLKADRGNRVSVESDGEDLILRLVEGGESL